MLWQAKTLKTKLSAYSPKFPLRVRALVICPYLPFTFIACNFLHVIIFLWPNVKNRQSPRQTFYRLMCCRQNGFYKNVCHVVYIFKVLNDPYTAVKIILSLKEAKLYQFTSIKLISCLKYRILQCHYLHPDSNIKLQLTLMTLIYVTFVPCS